MGHVLKEIFNLVELKEGYEGRVKLSALSGIPSSKAEVMKDDADVVENVKAHAADILGENVDNLL